MDQKEQELRAELRELQAKLQDPAIFSAPEYPKLAKRQSKLEELVSLFDQFAKAKKAQAEAADLTQDKDPEIAAMAEDELTKATNDRVALEDKLSELLTPKDPNDERDAIIEIRAAAGGDVGGAQPGGTRPGRPHPAACALGDAPPEAEAAAA